MTHIGASNRLLRQYLSKTADFNHLDQHALDAIASRLNNRPRAVLGWQTPAEVYAALPAQAAAVDGVSKAGTRFAPYRPSVTEHRAQGAFAALMLIASGLWLIVFPLVHGAGRVIVPAVCSVLSFTAVGILLAGRMHRKTNRAEH